MAFRFTPSRDVIEETHPFDPQNPASVPIDMVGWTLAKALSLGLSSNPQLAEWSTITSHYVVDAEFHAQMKHLASFSSPRVLAHHYRGLATKTLETYLKGAEDPVGKKYLYAIRPILAARWMVENPHVGASPPVLFEDLRKQVAVPERVSQEIDTLLAWKMAQDEERGRRRFLLLDHWIVESIHDLKAAIPMLDDPWIDASVAEDIWEQHYSEIFPSPPPVGPCFE